MFYPVCDDLRNQYTGYDCFYDTNKAYHNHKFNEKEKNRFATDENKLTPFKEIEDHYFYVDNTQKYSKNGKLKNEAYIAFLTRDDGAKMILRVLFQPDKNTNAITQGMLVKFYSGGKMTTGVNLPYITKSAWENSHALKGTKLVRTSNDNYYLGKDIKYLRNGKTTKGYILDLVAENANRLKLELGGIKINAACPGGSQETLIPQSEHGEEKNNGAITIVIFILKTEN